MEKFKNVLNELWAFFVVVVKAGLVSGAFLSLSFKQYDQATAIAMCIIVIVVLESQLSLKTRKTDAKD